MMILQPQFWGLLSLHFTPRNALSHSVQQQRDLTRLSWLSDQSRCLLTSLGVSRP